MGKTNKNKIFNLISKKFKNRKIIVRSSSKNEDNLKTSAAGKFESILNVDSRSKIKTNKAINKVIKSYKLKK